MYIRGKRLGKLGLFIFGFGKQSNWAQILFEYFGGHDMFFGHIEFPDRLSVFFRPQQKKKKKGRHRNYFGENLGFTIFHKT